ncbi:MAG: SDR family oxidoreductase [Clostridia bacterium]|jgi:3-oxoacyl-[acyl-carrier protein] reductase|nr:SDR family oxidoreductase [Clostridia bacterium]MBT7122516.1 SDR family oxidoreductase [Clostridia bacterium]
MSDIKGKIAIVTGAGRGIGFATVKSFLDEGMKVVATSRNISKLNALNSDNLLVVPADLTDLTSFEKIVTACICQFGGLDVIINNAGYAKKALLTQTSAEEFDLHMAVNVRAPMLLVNEAMPHLLKSTHATVINVCSVVSVKGYETQGAYTASKHALLGYTKVLARETFKQNIRVHALSPGGVGTELIQETRPDLDFANLSTPQEMVDIMLFLLKNRNNAVIDQISVRRYTKEPWA